MVLSVVGCVRSSLISTCGIFGIVPSRVALCVVCGIVLSGVGTVST